MKEVEVEMADGKHARMGGGGGGLVIARRRRRLGFRDRANRE
jgi:hypothetical protein